MWKEHLTGERKLCFQFPPAQCRRYGAILVAGHLSWLQEFRGISRRHYRVLKVKSAYEPRSPSGAYPGFCSI